MERYVIKGIPTAQGRPRFFRRGKFVGVYDPDKSAQGKNNTRAQLVNQAPVYYEEGPLALILYFLFPRPKSHYTKKGLRPNAPIFHCSRPDLDNLTKNFMDAATGILWKDDSLVSRKKTTKKYTSEEPGIEVRIYRICTEPLIIGPAPLQGQSDPPG